ncbi:MAG: AAC(3) family N-acetyltransferase [Blastocatellia bacterium]|nr:AAC(3) family N-acetyltransferase [Blastocatellia bacterium]
MKRSVQAFARRVLPASAVASLRRSKHKLQQARIARLPVLGETDFSDILANDLGLGKRDTVFVHSSVDKLNLGFPFYRIIALIRDAIGPQGTVLFPTYSNHRISSYQYLLQGHVFNVRRTPSYMGLLSEFARRHADAVRSLHPTKSVCAIGPLAKELTATHQHSPYPYDKGSPFFKLVEHNAKIIGLGVGHASLSFTYCVADALKDDFPVRIYHSQLFKAPCINYCGETEIVETYAQNMDIGNRHNAERYMKSYIPEALSQELDIKGMKFLRVDAAGLFVEMLRLAKNGITCYPRAVYSQEYLASHH